MKPIIRVYLQNCSNYGGFFQKKVTSFNKNYFLKFLLEWELMTKIKIKLTCKD